MKDSRGEVETKKRETIGKPQERGESVVIQMGSSGAIHISSYTTKKFWTPNAGGERFVAFFDSLKDGDQVKLVKL